MFDPVWKCLRRAVTLITLLAALLIASELARVALMARRIHPLAGWAAAGVMVIVALVVLVRWMGSGRIPIMPPRPRPEDVPASTLIEYTRCLIRYLIYLGELPTLQEESRQTALKGASEFQGLMKAHPIKDDLTRVLDVSEQEILIPVFNDLREQVDRQARPTILDTMKDAFQGPFVAFSPVFASWRAFTLTAAIVRTYHPEAVFSEWFRLLRGCLETAGAFPLIRIGRLLSHGLLANSAAKPAMADDIARALSVGWMLCYARQNAIAWCEEGAGLHPISASAWRDKECFLQAAELIVSDLAVQAKNRLRAAGDPLGEIAFLDHISNALQSAYESTLRAWPKDEGHSDDPAQPAEKADPRFTTRPPDMPLRSHRRRHHHRSRRPSMLFTLVQRIKYGVIGQRIHRHRP